MEFFRNRTVQIVLGIILAFALLFGGYLFFINRQQAPVEEAPVDEFVTPISASELGLTMEANDAKNQIRFAIAKATGIISIEYQLTYEADSTAAEQAEGGEDRVQRGITGEDTVSGSSFKSEWIDLGSESAGVKRYDKGVTSVTLTLKITKKDGKIYEAEQTLTL